MIRSFSRPSAPRPIALVLSAVLALYFVPLGALVAHADHIVVPGGEDVTIVDGAGENCNGIAPTPGSENTTKTIAPGSSFEPGGVVTFTIDYPKVNLDTDDRFRIQDCFVLFVGKTTIVVEQFEILFVPNEEDFTFQYNLVIPANAPLGAVMCNIAKTTEGPSASPASNRKADACFVVGGNLRIVKVDQAGNPLSGAKFDVSCVAPEVTSGTTAELVIIGGLVTTRGGATAATAITTGRTTAVTGYTTATGAISIVGPSSTECTVTEREAPSGYQLADPATRVVTIPIGDAQIVTTFTNPRLVGGLTVSKTTVGGAGTFTFDVDCSDNAHDRKDSNPVVLVVGANATQSTILSGIPTGTVCTVTERNHPLFSKTAQVPVNGQVTIDTDGEAVSFTNTRLTGAITVTKRLDGAANGASTSFTFDVNCPETAYDQSLTVNVTNGVSASGTTGQIPTGTTCTVTERGAPDWKLTSTVPAGGVVTVGSTVTFTNTRLQGALTITKAVSPVAGRGVVVEFGDTLTYTLTVTATGEQRQPQVVVTDYVPGFDPARTNSGKTTYVAGSAACIGAGDCVVTQPGANGLITWALGEMAAGTTRQVTFKVVINDVAGNPGDVVAVDILNAGAVQSARTPKTPSNEVSTPVTKVLPVKVSKPPAKVLPRTGSPLPVGLAGGTAVALLGLGVLLAFAGRKRPVTKRNG